MAWIVKTENYSAWDAGARTVASFGNDGAFIFTVGQSTGIVCGLNSEDLSASNVEIDHGFFIESTKTRIIERGVSKTLPITYSKSHTFKIERVRGVVTYYINDVLIYTSLTESTGNVFGDCSLYSQYDEVLNAQIVDYGVTGDGVAEINATLPALTAKADEFDQVLIGEFPALSAIGSEFDQVLLATFSALTVEGVVDSGERLTGILPALTGFGSVQAINFIRSTLPALTASGSDLAELVPEYNALNSELPRLYAGGYEFIDENNHVASTLPALNALGLETDQNYGYAVLPTVTASGYLGYSNYFGFTFPGFSIDFRQLVDAAGVWMVLPELTLRATANDDDNAQANLTLPTPTLTTRLGATTHLTLPAPVLTTALTSEGFATVDLTLPELTLDSLGYVGDVADSVMTLPELTLTAAMGAYASLEMVAPVLTATATSIGLAQASLTLPSMTLTAIGETYGFATVALEIPALELLSGPSRVEVELPVLILTAQATNNQAEVIVTEVTVVNGSLTELVVTETLVDEATYAINLNTGAVTKLLLGKFDKLVIARGRLYGLQGATLHRLGGEVDGVDTAIPATVRFAPQTFGTNQVKRMSDVYLNTRENDGMTLTVVADETTSWQYQTPTDKALAYGTHKVKTGRGVSFHTAGLILQNRNGGKLDVGGVELLVNPLSRKI